MRKLDLSTASGAESRRNRIAIFTVGMMNVTLAVAYLLQMLSGNIEMKIYIPMLLFCAVPNVIAVLYYKRKPDSSWIKFVFAICFVAMYFFVMTTRKSNMVFCYYGIVLIALMVNCDTRLLGGFGVGCLAINIYGVVTRSIGITDGEDAEISIIFIIMSCIYAILVCRGIKDINQANEAKLGGVVDTVKGVVTGMLGDISSIKKITGDLNERISDTKAHMDVLTQGAAESSDELQVEQQSSILITSELTRVTQHASSINELIGTASANVETSQDTMGNLLNVVTESDRVSKSVVAKLEALQEDTEKMQSILSTISNIASQTHLLSLNASIEAARAGEAGKGFNVVAEEISSLSKQTTDATKNIGELIDSLSNSLTETSNAINDMLKNSEEENTYINSTAECLSKISIDVMGIATRSNELSEQIRSASQANDSISASIEHSSAVTEEVSAGANETLKSAMEDLESVEELSVVVASLQDGANKLQAI